LCDKLLEALAVLLLPLLHPLPKVVLELILSSLLMILADE